MRYYFYKILLPAPSFISYVSPVTSIYMLSISEPFYARTCKDWILSYPIFQGEPGIGMRGEKGATGQKGDKGDRGHLGLPVSTPDFLSVDKFQIYFSSMFYMCSNLLLRFLTFLTLTILGTKSLFQYNNLSIIQLKTHIALTLA